MMQCQQYVPALAAGIFGFEVASDCLATAQMPLCLANFGSQQLASGQQILFWLYQAAIVFSCAFHGYAF